MAQIAGFYDEKAEPSADFGPIPAGEYEAQIVDSQIEELKDGKGRCLLLVWKVVSGDMENRQVWQRLNLWFEGSEKKPGMVVQVANQQFASVRKATGVASPADTAELHNIPCTLRVDYIGEKNGYKPKNEVAAVKPIGSFQPSFAAPANGQAAAPPASAPAASAPAANSARKAPWPSRAA